MTRLACALAGAFVGSAALVVWAELPELRDWWRDHIRTARGYV